MVPALVPALVGFAAVGAAAYYFASNHGNAKRTEFVKKMHDVLEALNAKAELLKREKEAVEAACQTAVEEREYMRSYCEKLEAELARTLQERDKYQAEIELWSAYKGTLSSGLSIVKHSHLLANARYIPRRALKNLQNRALQLEGPALSPDEDA